MLTLIIVLIVGVLLVLFITILIYKAVYKKVPPDAALIVSNSKGRKVYFSSKAINPFTSNTQKVFLNTIKLVVERKGLETLVTKNDARRNVTVEFFVKVQPEEEDVLTAAESLGEKPITPENVKELLEGKLINALRIVAQNMTSADLDDNQQKFQSALEEACKDDLKENGFTIENISITHLAHP